MQCRRGRDLKLPVGVFLTLLVIVIAVLGYQQWSAKQKCQANLEAIGSAVRGYTIDHGGNLPDTLTSLTPGMLNNLPTCPNHGTYRYEKGPSPITDPVEMTYTVICSDRSHYVYTPDGEVRQRGSE